MALKQSQSAEECVYFTNRTIDNGKARVWVFKKECPKCHKAVMGKPRDKTGKVMIRAKEYVCPNCGYKEDKKTYEESLTANIEYKCPHCGYEGEIQVPFKRKKVEGVDTLQFLCQNCSGKINVTKKIKVKGEKEGK